VIHQPHNGLRGSDGYGASSARAQAPKLAIFENSASKHHRHARLLAHESFKPLRATISPIPPSIRITSSEPILLCFISLTIRESYSSRLSGSKEFPDSTREWAWKRSQLQALFRLIIASSWPVGKEDLLVNEWPNHAMNDRRYSA
jgi:hypothetical protein